MLDVAHNKFLDGAGPATQAQKDAWNEGRKTAYDALGNKTSPQFGSAEHEVAVKEGKV